MKKKGFTTVELVVSFALVMTIAVLLFQIVLSVKNMYVNSNTKTQLLNKQAVITNQINEKLFDKKLDSYTSCGEDCLHLVYMDGTSDDLIINKQEKYIEFANNRTYLLDKSTFGSIVLDTYTTPVYQDYHNDSMMMINIPIYYNNNLDKDYGIHIVYQYNSKGSNIKPNPGNNDLAQTLRKECSETNTVGLIKDTDGTCYYKGTNEEVSNNFVWFGGHLWRVLTVNEDNTLTMITQQPITAIQPASNRWTTEEEYQNSYVNTWLNEVFLGSMEESDKLKIQDNIFNIGIYNNVSEITTTQKVGLLDEEQYKKAGKENSFLDIKDNFWLGNRHSTSDLHYVDDLGYLIDCGVANAWGVRAVIKISNLTFTEGEGTFESPYREKRKVKDITQVKVGEYINVATSGTDCGEDKRCLFRVVSKDNDSIKVILNGLLPNGSAFDVNGNVTYTKGNTVDTVVTTFASTIDNQYQYIGNKSFNIGRYEYGSNYTAVKETKYTGTEENPVNVGLPVVGEMFSGNDIDLSTSTTKIFVNTNTIENPDASDAFLIMNAFSASYVRGVGNNGRLSNGDVANVYGVRPVLFLKNNLTFTSGEGTAENPFVLE